MTRAFVTGLLLVLSLCVEAGPAAPQNGLWWNPSESGRGYSIDSQNETLVLSFFGYDDGGRMQWYYADGPLGCGGYCWSGTLIRFDNGQPLNGAYHASTQSGNAGTVSIDFTSRVTGSLKLPGGRVIPIQRFNFAAGNAPQALLGQWSYTYLIGTSWFVDVYVLSTVLGATSGGNGVVANSARNVGFELQTSGVLAGRVVGFHYSSTGAVLDQYAYQLQLEEGRGSWVSPSTFNEYGMSAAKMYTGAGTAKGLRIDSQMDVEDREGSSRKPKSLLDIARQDPEMGRIASEIWEQLKRETAAAR